MAGETVARNGEAIAVELPPWLNPFQLVAWVRYRDASIAEESDTHTNLAAKNLFRTVDQVGSADQALRALRSGRLRSYGAERGCKMTEIEAVEWTRIELAPLNPERQHPYESITFRCEDVVAAFPPLKGEGASQNEATGSLSATASTIGLPLQTKLQPVAPKTPSLPLPPEQPFVSLSHALSWIAFDASMDCDQLRETLEMDRYGEHDPQEATKAAVSQLLDRARDERVALQGKYRECHRDEKRTLLTAPIDPLKLADFRQFNHLSDELRHGEGLTWWRTIQGVTDRLVRGGRSDSFIEVSVKRADLLREFPPRVELSEREHFRCGRTFKRDDPAAIAPWWTINQSLAWIATRIPSYVEYIGDLETDEPREHRPYIVHAICESQVAESDEGQAFIDARRASWPAGSFLAHAGRALLDKILAGEVRPMTRENGQGRQMRPEEFAGIGGRETGSDWLDLTPQPLFSSAEVIAAFSSAEVEGAGNGRGKVPANRQLDHEKIIERAGDMREEQPGISLGSAAASIRAELPPNPKTGKPRDQRGIERIIAHLWEGKAA